jgi:hypothetical protein
MKNLLINREIIRHIIGSLGVAPPPNLGVVGMTSKEYLVKDHITTVEYDGSKKNHPIWFGSCTLGDGRLYAMITDVYDEELHEFAVVTYYTSGKIYGFKHLYTDDDFGVFLQSLDLNTWSEVSLYEKLKVCAAFENMADIGIEWTPESKDDDNYKRIYLHLVSLLNY